MGKRVFPFLDQDGAFQQVGRGQGHLAEDWEDTALDSSPASWGGDTGEAKYAAFPIVTQNQTNEEQPKDTRKWTRP